MREVGFPTPLTVKLTGVTDGTLEHWNDRDFLKPSIGVRRSRGGGAPRVYSFRDVVAIRVVDQLRTSGIELRHLRDVVAYLRDRPDLDFDGNTEQGVMLLTDGHTFVEVDGSLPYPEFRWPGGELPKVVHIVQFGRLVTQLRKEARALLAA